MTWFAQIARMIFCICPDRHRQRRTLREMDDDQLYDFGISRNAAMQEGRKPFWR